MRRRVFLSSIASARVLGANSRIRVGLIGSGPRGQYLLKEILKTGMADAPAVCDVWDVRRAQARQMAGAGAEEYLDYQQVIGRKDLDAVIVATPDHWHAKITVEALNAGKDVYVEKPMVHFPADGQAIVRAVRANRRVLQVGTQGRGMRQFVEAKARFLDTGGWARRGWRASRRDWTGNAGWGRGRRFRGMRGFIFRRTSGCTMTAG